MKQGNLEEASAKIEQKTPWSVEETVRLLIASYKFSQGNTILQRCLFGMLAKQFPDRSLPSKELDREILRQAQSAAKKIIFGPNSKHPQQTVGQNPGIPISSFEISHSLMEELSDFRDMFTAPLSNSVEGLQKMVVLQIIGRDKRFAERKKSFFKDYIVDQHETGTPEFNLIFQELKKYLLSKNVDLNGNLDVVADQLNK